MNQSVEQRNYINILERTCTVCVPVRAAFGRMVLAFIAPYESVDRIAGSELHAWTFHGKSFGKSNGKSTSEPHETQWKSLATQWKAPSVCGVVSNGKVEQDYRAHARIKQIL